MARRKSKSASRRVDPGSSLRAHVQQRRHGEPVGAERGHRPAPVAVDHGHDAVDEVAKAPREVRVGTRAQPARGEVGVPDAGDLTQQPPAHRVGAVRVGEGDRVDGGPAGFADLAAVDGEVVVDEDVGGQRQTGRQQHRRPVHGVKAHHTLADQMGTALARHPPLLVGGVVGAVAEAGDVVAQRVPPHVDDLGGVAGHGDAPAAGTGVGAGDGEIVQTARDQGQDLVAAGGGFDAQGAVGDQLVQPAGVAGQPEEPVLLRHELRLGAVLGAAPVDQFGLGVELLAADAVQAFVVLAVQVSRRRAPAPQPFDADAVARVAAGADEVVERQRERAPQGGERLGVAVDQRLYVDALGLGGQYVLQGVVVGSAQQAYVVAPLAAVPGQGVRLDELQGEAQVRACIDVRDRRGDVVAGCGHRNLLFRETRPGPHNHVEAPSPGPRIRHASMLSSPVDGASSDAAAKA